MISPDKLFHLQGGQKRRKLALCFGALERDIAGVAENGCGYSFPSMPRAEYVKKLVAVTADDPQLTAEARAVLLRLLETEPFDERRACNFARNQLLRIIGTFPAEWDLIIAPHKTEADEASAAERAFFPGTAVYAEDLRSPFNLGSVFRSAEAMGAEQIFLSPFCVDPSHPRALRSAMGCIGNMPWRRTALEELPEDVPVFALETGGTSIEDFVFPPCGIVIIGSEELGCSPQALRRADYGIVSIPMTGIKASLNVGVAFGILMHAWTAQLRNGNSHLQ
ncbi:MAG: TrmH family RNA methyltransferase [Bacteroides sp.]|nr:TrmH family RNA methyltransferase [Prevotella sp.]MCM1408412.1 TrmH family RNA methyltransferase [Treponema brennaborense]MCM1469426.1 TrmH family RNA methyltransferase [Bacteroides sp.]